MKRRLFTALAALTVLLAMATPVGASAPLFAGGDSPASDGIAGHAVDGNTLEAVEATAIRTDALKDAKDGIFIVRLTDEPVAMYRGGISGFQATNPTAAGVQRLDVEAPAAKAYAGYLRDAQARFIDGVESELNRSIDVSATYVYAVNAFAADLTVAEARALTKMPGVAAVIPNGIRQINTDAGPPWIGAPGLWGADCGDYCGEGVIVGVIDTGINPGNPSFADVGGDGYDHTNPWGSGNYVGVCDAGDDSYDPTFDCNDKLIGAWSFINYPTSDPVDDDGHGSHTASTAAGNFVTAHLDTPTLDTDVEISGVAPHANIIMYDACDASGCPFQATLGSIEQAIADGVDVINYSIGGGAIDPWADTDSLAFLAAREAGIFVATSAGNDGPDVGTVGSPAVAPWLTGVAASTHDRQYPNGLINMTGGNTAPPVDMEGLGFTTGYGPAPIVWAGDIASGETGTPELCGVGALGDFNSPWDPGTFTGEIVVCERGTFGRVEMGENVAFAGGGGYVLIDDGGGLVGDAHEIPGVHISADDGVILKAWLADGGTDHMATIEGTAEFIDPANGDVMAGFSSRGPNTVLPIVSPSVAAPGVDIIAADGIGVDDSWGFNSGTSMASPHVAGAAALLVQSTDWTPAQIQSALMLTATTAMFKEDMTTPADPFDMGSGRIQVDVAMASPLLLHETISNYELADPFLGGDPTELNLASAANDKCVLVCTWTREVEATAAGTWDVAASDDGNFELSVDPVNFSLAEGATQVITITADVTASDVDEWFFGDIMITGTGPDVHMPVAVQATRGDLPPFVDIWAQRDAGSVVLPGVTSIEIELLTIEEAGYAKAHQDDLELSEDSNNGSPYDDLGDGVFFTTFDVPAGTWRLVAETFDSSAPDLDLFVGTGTTPSEGTEVCSSTTGTAIEYCDITDPAAGDWWILVQNWDGVVFPAVDSFTLSYGLVGPDMGNMLVEGPDVQPELEPFDLRLFWDIDPGDIAPGDIFYGAFSLGTSPSDAGNVGRVPIDLMRHEDDVVKTADNDNPFPGEEVEFTITVNPNLQPEEVAYEIVDHIPAGLTYVPGSATGGLQLRSDGALTWAGSMPVLDSGWELTREDVPACGIGWGYLDLALFGIYPNAGITGDTIWFTAFGGQAPITFYGEVQPPGINFTDDGFAFFDPSTPGDEPWVNQDLPDLDDPNSLMAALWSDFIVEYELDGLDSRGVTLAVGGPATSIIDWSGVEPWSPGADDPERYTFQLWVNALSPTAPEIVFAVEDMSAPLTWLTVGLENEHGTEAELAHYDGDGGTVGPGSVFCYDWVTVGAEPTVLTYRATVDEGTDGTYVTNTAYSTTDNPGSKQEPASVEIALGDVDAPEFGPDALTTHDKLSSSLRLEWTEATDNVAVFAYDVYVNDVMVGTVGPSTFDFFVDGLVPESFNEFAVVARDEVGNESDPAEASATMSTDFVDDNFSIFESDIEWMSGRGITFGCNPPTNDMFCPDDNLTRGQLAAFIARALDLPPGPDAFTDDDGNIFEGDINAIAAAGIAHGCAVDSYCPNDLATRGQLAAMFKIAFGLPDAGDDYFDDDNGHPFEDAINSMFEAEITFGCGANAYCPDDPLTRGMVAAFFRRAFRYNGWW